MKKKVAVKKVRSKKIEVKHAHDVIKEAQSDGTVAETILEPVNLAVTLPTHTPGLERC